jgi:hypothetical protein
MKAKRETYSLTTAHSKYEVYLSFGTYRNGRTSIELLDATDGCPVMVATVNLENAYLTGDEIIIKDYSENQGVLDFLIANGFVSRPKRWISSGWVTCPVVDLLVKPY